MTYSIKLKIIFKLFYISAYKVSSSLQILYQLVNLSNLSYIITKDYLDICQIIKFERHNILYISI